MPGYVKDGQYVEVKDRFGELPFDHELAIELAELFKRRTGMTFKQSRFLLLPSQTQNDLIRDASIAVQNKRKRRQQK